MNFKILKLLTLYTISIFVFFSYNLIQENYNLSLQNFVIGLFPVSFFLYGYLSFKNSTKLISNNIYASKLTSIYKYYIPITYITWVIVNVVTYVLNIYTVEIIRIEDLCFQFFGVLLLLIPFTQLKLLFIENKEIIIYNYSKPLKFNMKDVAKIKRLFFIFAVIEIRNNTMKRKYFIMPRLDEFWYLNYFNDSKSLKEIKSKIIY